MIGNGMKFSVSDDSDKPKYEQLKTQIRSAVYSGELTEGQALPSLRRLAAELGVSVLTVARTYDELASEGIVRNEQGRGTFVALRSGEVLRRRLLTKTRENLEEACAAAQRADISMQELEQMLAEIYADIEQQRLG
jgi:GntR family transcriptional regulator